MLLLLSENEIYLVQILQIYVNIYFFLYLFFDINIIFNIQLSNAHVQIYIIYFLIFAIIECSKLLHERLIIFHLRLLWNFNKWILPKLDVILILPSNARRTHPFIFNHFQKPKRWKKWPTMEQWQFIKDRTVINFPILCNIPLRAPLTNRDF